MDLQLVVLGGALDGQVFELPEGVTLRLGRLSSCELVVPDDSVSRMHCSLKLLGREILVTDLDSTNGTFINNVRVNTGRLWPGDRLTVGSTVLECRAAERRDNDAPR